jgi:hypothetical protein
LCGTLRDGEYTDFSGCKKTMLEQDPEFKFITKTTLDVRRCRITVSKLVLKAPMVSAISA